MDPRPPEIVVLSNPVNKPLETWMGKQMSNNSSLPVPSSVKQRKAPPIFVVQNSSYTDQYEYCIDDDYLLRSSSTSGLPAISIENNSDDDSKSDWSNESIVSLSTSTAFTKLVATINFLKKWASRTETVDSKNEFLKKFKMSSGREENTENPEDNRRNSHVVVRIRRKLWKKTSFFNPAGNVLYWYAYFLSITIDT